MQVSVQKKAKSGRGTYLFPKKVSAVKFWGNALNRRLDHAEV
jgi:hypothetical protein